MSIVPITFNDKNVPSAVDGGFYHAHNGDGILLGCGMTITASELIIQSGLIIACGRIVRIDGATQIDLSEEIPSSGYLQVVLNVSPLADPPTSLSFNTSGGAVFPALTQEDINANPSGLYQLELAVVQVSGGNLTAITSSVRPSHLITSPSIIIESDASIGVNPSARFFYDGVVVGQVYSDAGTDIRIISNGQDAGKGLYLEPNYVSLWADGQPIILRPNGGFNTLNQIEFTAAGQQLGGHPKTSLMTATAITCQADRDTDIQTVSGLDPNGVYEVTAGASFAPSASTGTQFRFALTSGNDAYTQSVYTASTASHMVSVGGLFSGTSWVTLRAHPYSGTVSCNATYRKLCLVRIH